MDTILFFLYVMAYIGLFSWGSYLAKKTLWLTGSNVLLLVIAGLIYDNGTVATGRYIGKGDVLENLNYIRFWLHAFLTPLLVIFASKTLKRAGIQWAKKSWVRYGTYLLVIGLIIMELTTEVIGLELEAQWDYGVLSYRSTEVSGSLPIMVVTVSVVLLLTSIIIWYKQKWTWFFIGSLLMAIGSAIKLPVESAAVINGFELIFTFSLLATKYYQDRLGM